jgi:hypothetical protein
MVADLPSAIFLQQNMILISGLGSSEWIAPTGLVFY